MTFYQKGQSELAWGGGCWAELGRARSWVRPGKVTTKRGKVNGGQELQKGQGRMKRSDSLLLGERLIMRGSVKGQGEM